MLLYMVKPVLHSTDYNADKEIFYGKIASENGYFKKDISINIPIKVAKDFYKSSKNIQLLYQYKNNSIYLKDIKINYKGKYYLAKFKNTASDIDNKISKSITKHIKLFSKSL